MTCHFSKKSWVTILFPLSNEQGFGRETVSSKGMISDSHNYGILLAFCVIKGQGTKRNLC